MSAPPEGNLKARANEERWWRWIEDAAQSSRRARQEDAEFDRFENFLDVFDGQHWPTNMPSFRPPVVANELRTLILSEASDLTEGQLRIFISKDRRFGNRDEERERAFRAIWRREQVDLKLMMATVWGLVIGTAFMSVDWDVDAHGGFGDVRVEADDPRTVLPDPQAVDDKNWTYCIKERILSLMEIRRRWPQSGWRVEPEDGFSQKDPAPAGREPGMTAPFYMGPLTNDDSLLSTGFPGYRVAAAKVYIVRLQDPTLEEVYVETGKDESGTPKMEKRLKPKYPYGRIVIAANRVVLADGPNMNPSGDFGTVRLLLEPSPGKFWGRGFVHQTSELNLAADKLLSMTIENGIRLNNGIVKMTTNTGLDMETFAGIPAQIIQINPGSEFDIVYPNPMPAEMVQAPERYLDLQRRILGFPDARSGVSGRGNVSPDLTEAEIVQAQAVTRLRSRMMYSTVQRLAEMIFSRMIYGYTTERAIPAVEGEAWKPAIWTAVDNPLDYSVYVDPASINVMSKTALRRLGIALFKLRAIDRAALLERMEWPDWETVSARLDKADQMAAQAKAMAKKAK